VLGLGLLATGSGAIFTSAAFNNSVNASSNMRVVVDKRLEVRAGQAFNDGGTINANNGNVNQSNYTEYVSNETFFENSSNLDPEELVDIDSDDLPVATVNRRDQNVNGDVIIQVAVDVDTTSVTFNDILEIENQTEDSVEVGIGYDRNTQTSSLTDSSANSNSNFNQYGEDVNVGGTSGVTAGIVQKIYQFTVPDPSSSGDNTISPTSKSTKDEPGEVQSIPAGSQIQVSLRVDLSNILGIIDVQDRIKNQTQFNPSNPFQQKRDTVDLLDAITVGVQGPNNPF